MKKHSKMNSSQKLPGSESWQNRHYGYAYQNLRSDISQTITNINLIKHKVPEDMKLSEHINPNTAKELEQCINAARTVYSELSGAEDFNSKIALGFLNRLISDMNHFTEEYVSDGNLHHDYVTEVSGDAHHHES